MSRDVEHTASGHVAGRGGVKGEQTDSCCHNRGFDAGTRSDTCCWQGGGGDSCGEGWYGWSRDVQVDILFSKVEGFNSVYQ